MTISGRAVCVQCGTEISSFSSRGRRYCSDACRQAAWRARNGISAIDVRAWEGTTIQRRRADGYVNATAMCQAGGKQWFHYRPLQRTQEYLRALSGSIGIPMDHLIRAITTGPNNLRGTWIHPRLAVDLARWISPEFAVWMDGWFLEAAAHQSLPRQRKTRRVAPAPAQSMGNTAAEELFKLLTAVTPYLAEKEWQAQMLGEPEESPAYQTLMAAISGAQVVVGLLLRQVPAGAGGG